MTAERNKYPTISGRGGYVPSVKLVRQIRSAHLGDAKPGGLYFELLCYWAFQGGVDGDSQAEILAKTLRSIATQLGSGAVVTDPALGQPYSPAPDPAAVEAARNVFAGLAGEGEAALSAEKCPAAAAWRRILGANSRGACFPLPEGCDETGRAIATAATAVAARGSREAGGFG